MSRPAEIKVLTAGAFRPVVMTLLPAFEQTTGYTVTVAHGTVGQVTNRVEQGERFDVLALSARAIEENAQKGRVIAGSTALVGRVGIGVMVKAGVPKPDIGSVEAFKRALLQAKSIAYLDPTSGGSSGVDVEGLPGRLGIADAIRPKLRLQLGGHVSDRIVAGEAELGIHQISAILREPRVALVGPLPPPIQNYTTYSSGHCGPSA